MSNPTLYIALLHSHKSAGSLFATDIHNVVLVREAIEASGRAAVVGAMVLEVEPITNINRLGEEARLGDLVNSIASRAPKRVLDATVGSFDIVHQFITHTEQTRAWLLVVKGNAREVAVNTIIEVQHVGRSAGGGIGNGATGNDVACNGERILHVVPARFSDDADAGRHVLVNGGRQNGGLLLKGLGDEPSADIQSVEAEAKLGGLVKDPTSVPHSVVERIGVRGTGADVEGHTDNLQLKLLGKLEKLRHGLEGGAILHAQLDNALRIIGGNAEVQLGVGEVLLDLVQLVMVVKSHLLDAVLGGVADVRLGLARLGKDNAVRVDAGREDQFNLGLGGTIEARAQFGQEPDHGRVGIAFDRCMSRVSACMHPDLCANREKKHLP